MSLSRILTPDELKTNQGVSATRRSRPSSVRSRSRSRSSGGQQQFASTASIVDSLHGSSMQLGSPSCRRTPSLFTSRVCLSVCPLHSCGLSPPPPPPRPLFVFSHSDSGSMDGQILGANFFLLLILLMVWWCNDLGVRLTTSRSRVRLPAVLGQVVNSHTVIKQYILVVKRQRCPTAGKVTAGLASHWPCVTDLVVYPPTAQGLSETNEHHADTVYGEWHHLVLFSSCS